jgi:hypothetical protein
LIAAVPFAESRNQLRAIKMRRCRAVRHPFSFELAHRHIELRGLIFP